MTRLRRLRNVFLSLLAFTLVVGVLSGCGESGAEPEDETEAEEGHFRLSSSDRLKAKLDKREAGKKEEEARRKAEEEELAKRKIEEEIRKREARLRAEEEEMERIYRNNAEVYAHFGNPCRPAMLCFLENIASPTELKTGLPLDPTLVPGPRPESDEAEDRDDTGDVNEEKKVFDPDYGRVVLAFDENTLRSMLAEIYAKEFPEADEEDDVYVIPDTIQAQRADVFRKLFEQMIEPPEAVTPANREAFRKAAAEKFAKAFAIFRRDEQALTVEDVTDAVARELFLDALGFPREMRQNDCRIYLGTITEKYVNSDLIPGLPQDDPEERQKLAQKFIFGTLNPRMRPPAEMVIPIIRNVRIKEDLFRRMKKSGIVSLDSMTVNSLYGERLEYDNAERLLAYCCELELTASIGAIDAFIDSLHQAFDSGFVYLVSGIRFPRWAGDASSSTVDELILEDDPEGYRLRIGDPKCLIPSCVLRITCLYDSFNGKNGDDGLDVDSLLSTEKNEDEEDEDDNLFVPELLALCYSHGIGGVDADPAEAEKWRKKVREAEIGEAFLLGETLGVDGVNLSLAVDLLKTAAENGYEEARQLLKKTEDQMEAAKDALKSFNEKQVKEEQKRVEKEEKLQKSFGQWIAKFNLTETDPGSDQDGDGFTLKDEFEAKTDPTDSLSHPEYITRIRVQKAAQTRYPGLQMISVNMNKPDKKDWDIMFSSQVVSGSSVTKKNQIVRIGRQLKNIDSKRKNVDFEVIDIELDEKTQEPVVYLRRVGQTDERIPCRSKQDVYEPQQKVQFGSALPLWPWSATCESGAEFKLGTEKTGEERYRLVSVDTRTMEAVVETLEKNPETFTIPPADKEASASGDTGSSPILQKK